MHRKTTLAVVGATAIALVAAGCGSNHGGSGSSDGGGGGGGTVNLSFESLAWQPQSIKANKRIVADWNHTHPGIHVKYVQGDWGSIGDQLTTEFQAGKAPDIFHFYDGGLQTYADRGDLIDLTKYIQPSFQSDIRAAAWQNVSFAGAKGVWGVPFLQEPILIYANQSMLTKAKVPIPTPDHPWTWDEYARIAKKLTVDANGDGKPEVYGAAMPLKDGGVDNTISLGLSFGANYFTKDGTAAQWQQAETEVPSRFHDMIYTDKSMSKDVLGLGSTDVLPPFFAGKYATIFGGTFIRQQLDSDAPKGFKWVALPPLMGTSQQQSNGAQTLSVSAQTKHPKEAAEFLQFFLSPSHQAELARGDWETPTSIKAGQQLAKIPTDGWGVAIAASADLVQGAYQRAAGYDEWSSKVGTSAFADYYANKISLDDLGKTLVQQGDPVLKQAASR